MSKPSWHIKAMYSLFALALVFGLSLTAVLPSQKVAEAEIPPLGDFTITSGSITLNYDSTITGYYIGTSIGIRTGPYYMEMDFGIDNDVDPEYEYTGKYWAKVWVTNYLGSGSDRIDFVGQYTPYLGPPTNMTLTVDSGLMTVGNSGAIEVDLILTSVDMSMDGFIGIPEIMPSIALDVEGSIQKFILVNVPLFDEFGYHQGLMEQDFVDDVLYGDGLQDTLTWVQTLRNDDEIVRWWYWLGVMLNEQNVDIRGGGEAGDSFYELYSRASGDLAVFVDMNWVGLDGVEQVITLSSAEKKWDMIDHTILDLNPEYPETPYEPHYLWYADAGTLANPEYEDFSDFVYAWFYWGEGVPTPIHVDTAGHAIVHWWLIKDDAAGVNKAAIEALMVAIGECPTGDELPCGCGRYDPAPALSPLQKIDAIWDPNKAQFTKFTNLEDNFYYLEKSTDGTYIKTVTQGDWPGETRGLTMVTAANTGVEDILVVTLTEYPDEYNGENPVCVEMGEKHYSVPPPPEYVKTPQLAWAGQEVVLEQSWGDIIDSSADQFMAVYQLEAQSIGNISVGTSYPVQTGYYSNGDVWVLLNSTYPVSQAVLESGVQGEANINVKLYDVGPYGTAPLTTPLINYGFLVYYMAFEDVTLAEDITPSADMDNVNSNQDVNVAVKVRGWFKSDQLPGTIRPAVDTNGDGILDLPAGRYVMPDDWWALAGYDYGLRPNWDLMDSPEDDITSLYELGPFDTAVRTTDPPAEAEAPSIGPFSTLQRWSTQMMWIAEAATVPTSHPLYSYRDTVVPDGLMSWYDAPMPQGLVIFNITGYTALTALSALDKGDLTGYGYKGDPKVYQSPFYAAEVPSSPVIPANDYDWNSWGSGAKSGPYPFWTDLLKKSVGDNEPAVVNTQDMEVYCDNHGIAAMTVDGVNSGTVTVQATADYPAAFEAGRYAPVASDEIRIHWRAIELNPHFQSNKTVVAVEELLTFTNLTTAGEHPYVKAEWDFDNDGVFEVTKTGTEAQVMASVSWAYDEPGIYSVRLQMTDSAPQTQYEVRDYYIIVGTPPTVRISGQVRDTHGNDGPLSGMDVELIGGPVTLATHADDEGWYWFEGNTSTIREGTYHIRAWFRYSTTETIFQVMYGDAGVLAYAQSPAITVQEGDTVQRDIAIGQDVSLTTDPNIPLGQLGNLSAIYRNVKEVLDFETNVMHEPPDLDLPIEIRAYATGDNPAWYDDATCVDDEVHIASDYSSYENKNQPMNREWHECFHEFMDDTIGIPCMPANYNTHNGYNNDTTTGSWVEGWAEFWPCVLWDHVFGPENARFYRMSRGFAFEWWGQEILPGWVDLEYNHKAWAEHNGTQREEWAVASLLWDLYDPANCLDSEVVSHLWEPFRRLCHDHIQLPSQEIWQVIGNTAVNDMSDMKDVYDALKAAAERPDSPNEVRELVSDPDNDGLTSLDELFIMHGFFADAHGDHHYDNGEEIGRAAYPSKPDRRSTPPVENAYLLLSMTSGQPVFPENSALVYEFDYGPGREYFDYSYEIPIPSGAQELLAYFEPPSAEEPLTVTIGVKDSLGNISDEFVLTNSVYWDNVAGSTTGYALESFFDMSASGNSTVPIFLHAGWNMVSVPVVPKDNSVGAVFPEVAAVYTWDPVSKTYIMPNTIEPETGYWVAVVADTNITITGVPVATRASDIKAGWNMVGSVIDIASIADPNDSPDGCVQPFAYGWDPVLRQYVYTTDIEPGKGYWVASVQDCTLTMP